VIQKPEWLVSAERANQFIAELVVHELVGIEEGKSRGYLPRRGPE
jgi:hypothetical protein